MIDSPLLLYFKGIKKMELVARNKKDFINCFKDLDLELLEKRQARFNIYHIMVL